MHPEPTKRLKFSKARLLDLPPAPKGVSYYYDTDTKGLALSVGKSGRKSFLLYRKVGGKPRRIPIGPFPHVSIEQARAQADQLNGSIAAGQLPAATRKDVLFRDAFIDYMEKHSRPAKRTSSEDTALFERNLTGKRGWPGLANLNLNDVDGSLLRAVHRAMRDTPIAANRTMALVSSIFSHAIREGMYDKLNPARAVRKYPERSRERFVRKDEMHWLLESLDQEPDSAISDFVKLAIFTGARRGNILSLRWDDVDLEAREWKIGRTKNGDGQTLPLSEPAVQALERRFAAGKESEWVFPSISKTGHLVEPKKGWWRILERATALRLHHAVSTSCKVEQLLAAVTVEECTEFPKYALAKLRDIAEAAGLEPRKLDMRDLRLHDLRRTVGSWLVSSGASLPLIGKVLNHRTQQATQVYARFMLDPIRDALDQVARDVDFTRTQLPSRR